MGGFSMMHWVILLVVVVIVFGTSRIKNAGKDFGTAIKGFKDAMKEEDKPKATESITQKPAEKVVVEEVKVSVDDKA